MVSHYRVLDPLGGGGMGVVYDAEDARLGRRVALKFVPAELARDARALARLVREARAASALNHPHICTLFDIGEDEGQPFLVMERLEGKTLKNAIAGKPMAIDRVLELGAQMADALAAAHAKGIIHRDVKPANAFVTRRGDVKLLDFGLAKLAEPAGDGSKSFDADKATMSGELEPLAPAVGGTAAYMSPEQARGEEVDQRTDLFSLGAVLYEMTTGRPPFSGSTAAVVFAGILGRDPTPPRVLRPDLPPALEAILGKALEKDRHLRYQTAADLKVDLQRARRRSEPTSAPSPGPALGNEPPSSLRRRSAWGWTAVAGAWLLAAGAGAWAWAHLWRPTPPRFAQLTFRRGTVMSARFLPDGNSIVYSALWDGKPPEVFVRRLESPGSVSLGLPPATLLSVSSKGELAVLLAPPGERGHVWVGTLARVPLSGGPVRPLLEAVLDADWSPDGRELAVIRWLDGQFQLEYPVGTVLLRPCASTRLRVSPQGDQVAVLDQDGIMIVDRTGRRTLKVAPAHQRLAWSPDGSSLLVDAGDSDLRRTLRRVSLWGAVREVCALAGTLVVHDVSRTGRVLIHHGFERWSVRARAPGEAEEHDASVFANSQVQGLSADGNELLLWDGGEGPPGAALLLPTRGGPAVRLGEGHPVGLSADAAWLLMEAPDRSRPGFVLTPTGPGQSWPVPVGRLERFGLGPWHIDGRAVGLHAGEPGHPRRSFLAEMATGAVRPVTPEGSLVISLVPPGDRVLARSSDGTLAFYPLSGGTGRTLGWRLPESPYLETLGVGTDGRVLFAREGSVPARLERVDLESGRRLAWKTLSPPDSTGVAHIWTVLVTPDGEGYAYTYGQFLQDLFLVEGLS